MILSDLLNWWVTSFMVPGILPSQLGMLCTEPDTTPHKPKCSEAVWLQTHSFCLKAWSQAMRTLQQSPVLMTSNEPAALQQRHQQHSPMLAKHAIPLLAILSRHR